MIHLVDAYKNKEKIRYLKNFIERTLPVKITRRFIPLNNTSCVIISGSERMITEEGISHSAEEFLMEIKVPVLGICYGMQLISCIFGAKIERGENVKGLRKVEIIRENPLTQGLTSQLMLPESHSERIIAVSDKLDILAISKTGIEMVKVKDKDIYGTQFHFERSKKYGQEILKNFLRIAGEDV